jgi:hypothetical protein
MKVNVIDVIGQLADLKEADYKNTLAITILIELLIEKGIFTRQEFAWKARQLENETMAEVTLRRLER